MSYKPFSADELEQLARLRELGDEDIDLSDIPEMTEEQWKDPRRPAYELKRRRPVSFEIDGRIAHWFEDHAEGQPVEKQINRVLWDYVREQHRRLG